MRRGYAGGMTRRSLALLTVGVGIASLLSACATPAGTVSVQPAENASDPACASVVLNLPQEMTTGATVLPKRVTSSQATGAWGSPTAVIMRCGVPEPAPSTATCTEISGVDWISVGEDESVFTFVTYGRTPAVEVTVDSNSITGVNALTAISPALRATEQYSQCL